MNILTDEEIVKACNATGSTALLNKIARAIEAAVMSKLVEKGVDPVAYQSTRNGFIAKENKNPEYNIGLYTETQYIAAQQRTAEACAKVCVKFTADMCGDAIRNGEWREHL